MSDEGTAETPPGTPGRRALGAMESAVRRARESAGAPPLAPPPPPRASALAGRSEAAPPWETPRSPAPDGEVAPPPTSRPDGWLLCTVVTVAVLVVAAAIALIVSLTGGPAPSASTAAGSGTATTLPSRSQSTHPRSGGAQATTPTPSSSPTSTTVAVSPAGPPAISSLSPASGSPGQSVTVSGANFLSATGQIVATFNGQVAPTSCPAPNTCTVTVPPSTASSAQVVVTTPSGASNAETFTYG